MNPNNPLLDPANIAGFLAFVMLVGGFVWRITTWVSSKVKEEIEPISHKLNNQISRIDALELRDDAKEVRLVRLEVTQENILKGQDEIKASLKDNFAMLAQSIREVREVHPKP